MLANFSAIAQPSEPDCVGGDPHDVVTDLSYPILQELGQSLFWWRARISSGVFMPSLFLSPAIMVTTSINRPTSLTI